jgi:hypothetical protein
MATPEIPELRKLRQEKFDFEISQGYMVRTCLKNKRIS